LNGSGLSSTELIHLTGIGDFEVVQILGSLDPSGLDPQYAAQGDGAMGNEKVTRDKFCIIRQGDCEET